MTFARGLLHNLLVGAATLVVCGSAFAEKMDAEVHTIVIDKLELSLRNAQENETVSLVPVRARLADLYSERARLREIEEGAKNCQNCTGAESDRKRALELYEQVVRESPQTSRGEKMLQTAHLYQLTGKPEKAEALYNRVVAEGRSKHNNHVYASALIRRADRRFARGEVQAAQNDYQNALKYAQPYQRGPILKQIAWCHLNKGEQRQAVQKLVTILKSPELLTRPTTNGTTLDESFQEEVARDLSTFLARGSVTKADIRMVESLTPERGRRDNLKHFANECDRLGQKEAAIEVWAVALEYENNDLEHLEAKVRITQLRYDLGQKQKAISDMRGSIAFWNKKGCNDPEKCKELQERLRKLVLDWNRAEKKEPTALVLDAYLVYLSKFDQDMEMTHWAAELARKIKKHQIALDLYHKSSLLAAANKNQVQLEAAAVGEVEMAEIIKDKGQREKAYAHYMKINPNGAIFSKVHYQYAHVAYERGETREASNRFYGYVTSPSCSGKKSSDLCVKAADLDLDSLVLLKDHSTVEKRATAYSRELPQRRNEYLKIARTAILKQAEQENDPARALAKLSSADLTGADREERIKFQKTRLAYAEQARDVSETRRSAEALLRVSGLEPKDKEFALGKVVWATETEMDFGAAYAASKKMEMPKLSEADREMKLALYAELAGRSSRSHEEKFLRLSRDNGRKAIVRAKFVRQSQRPLVELRKHEAELKRYPQIYAPLALEVFGRTGDTRFAQQALRSRGVAQDPAGRVLSQQMFLRDVAKFDKQITKHRVLSSSDAILQRTLAQRIDLIAQGERAANIAISNKDWSGQVLTLTILSRENERLADTVERLPVPKRLKGAQREQYRNALNDQARGFQAKHEQIEKKLTILWGDSEAKRALVQDHKLARPEVRPLIAFEIRQLAKAAPMGSASEFEDALTSDDAKGPSASDVAKARAKVANDPFDESKLAKLRDLEQSRGKDAMVTYLDARIMKLKEQGVVKR